ncbi:MAG TPA: hypothetical protein VF094_04050 [Gaiellaceae bacterium]
MASAGAAALGAVTLLALTAATASARPATQHTRAAAIPSSLVTQLAAARQGTAKYVTNLPLARRDGYRIITKMIPNMGYHYMNPGVKSFDPQKPPILVYEHAGSHWQLAALEWVYTAKPAKAPFPGARYGAFGAGCHYTDGSFVPSATEAGCPKTAPGSAAAFSFWHPLLITLHVWLWYPNPNGLFASTNPLVSAYNQG